VLYFNLLYLFFTLETCENECNFPLKCTHNKKPVLDALAISQLSLRSTYWWHSWCNCWYIHILSHLFFFYFDSILTLLSPLFLHSARVTIFTFFLDRFRQQNHRRPQYTGTTNFGHSYTRCICSLYSFFSTATPLFVFSLQQSLISLKCSSSPFSLLFVGYFIDCM
jgi:hypothetical protein